MATLEVVKGANAGDFYELTANESVVGRYPFCEVVIPSHTVSRQHARISQTGGDYFLEDLSSLNGTFVNGKRVTERTRLQDQDRIRIYEILLLFHAGKPKPRGAVRTPARPTVAESQLPAEKEEAEPTPRVTVSAFEIKAGPPRDAAARSRLLAAMQITRELATLQTVDEVLGRLLDNVFEIFPKADRGHILFAEPPDGTLVPKVVKHRQEEAAASRTLAPISRKLAHRVMSRGEGLLSAGEADDGSSASVIEVSAGTTMCAPLIGPSRNPLGIIQLDSNDTQDPFNKDDLELLVSLGLVAGQATEQALLYAMCEKPESQANRE